MRHQHHEEFERCTVALPGDAISPAYRIVCAECGAQDKIVAAHGNRMPPDFVAKRFASKGWNVTKGKVSRDLCEKCDAKRREKMSIVPKPAFVIPPLKLDHASAGVIAMQPSPLAVEPPREMERDDKRIIFAKLNDVYLSEREGYSPGWSDVRVAKDLDVPVAWVAKVRDENFGPDPVGADVRQAIADARAAIADFGRLTAEAAQAKMAADKTLAALEAHRPSIDRLTRLVSDIAKKIGA